MAKKAKKAKRTAAQKAQLKSFVLWSIGITIGLIIVMYLAYS
jgi:hypothetical protein